MPASKSPVSYIKIYRNQRKQLEELIAAKEGDSRSAHIVRTKINQTWNMLTPQEQKQVAEEYLPTMQ